MTTLHHLIQTMTSSSKTLDTLIEDIYSVLNNPQKLDDSLYEELATDIATTIRARLSSESSKRTYLSLSSVGKPPRRLWYDMNEPDEADTGEQYDRLKFLYGDIIEDIVLWLAKVAGHTVSDRQKEVNCNGVIGHIDSIIDGEVVDAKSAAPKSFLKFSCGTLPTNDPFGYIAQLSAYDKETGKGNPGFLAMNKVTGELCLYRPDPVFDLIDPEEAVEKAKKIVAAPQPPKEKCYQPKQLPNGNEVLDKGCVYCPYKKKCWESLRAFKYSDGIKYLTKVEKEPKVEEITL